MSKIKVKCAYNYSTHTMM